MQLNLTYNGQGHVFDVPGIEHLNDEEVRMVAAEVAALPSKSLDYFVVDRFGETIYVRPKVPFGS